MPLALQDLHHVPLLVGAHPGEHVRGVEGVLQVGLRRQRGGVDGGAMNADRPSDRCDSGQAVPRTHDGANLLFPE